jgi:hypothetical protein
MDLSTLVAKIIAVIYISSGIAVLIGQVSFNEIAGDLDKSPALTFIAGSLGAVSGMILLEYHNSWVKNWTVLITIFSWALLLGGISVVIFPKSLSYFSRSYKTSPIWGILMIFFGLLFGYFGFVK